PSSYEGTFHSLTAPPVFFLALLGGPADFTTFPGLGNGSPVSTGGAMTHFYSPTPSDVKEAGQVIDGQVIPKTAWAHGLAGSYSVGIGGDYWKNLLAPSNKFTFAWTDYGPHCDLRKHSREECRSNVGSGVF